MRAFRGTLVKTIGDALLVTFRSPTDAVLCGMAIQDRLFQHNQAASEADRIEVRETPGGSHNAVAFGSAAKPATFRQKREGLDEYIDGDAERIDYDGKQDLTTLTTAATVRRLQGTSTIADTVHGSVITYDGQRDFYTAKGGKDVAAPGNPNGRVRAMLSPKNGGPAPLNGAPAKLSPSTTIQGAPGQ